MRGQTGFRAKYFAAYFTLEMFLTHVALHMAQQITVSEDLSTLAALMGFLTVDSSVARWRTIVTKFIATKNTFVGFLSFNNNNNSLLRPP